MQDKLIKDTKYLGVFFNLEDNHFSILNKNTGEIITLSKHIRFDKEILNDLDNISEEEANSLIEYIKAMETVFSQFSEEDMKNAFANKKVHSFVDTVLDLELKFLLFGVGLYAFTLFLQSFPSAVIKIWEQLAIPSIRFICVVLQQLIPFIQNLF